MVLIKWLSIGLLLNEMTAKIHKDTVTLYILVWLDNFPPLHMKTFPTALSTITRPFFMAPSIIYICFLWRETDFFSSSPGLCLNEEEKAWWRSNLSRACGVHVCVFINGAMCQQVLPLERSWRSWRFSCLSAWQLRTLLTLFDDLSGLSELQQTLF